MPDLPIRGGEEVEGRVGLARRHAVRDVCPGGVDGHAGGEGEVAVRAEP